MNILCLILARGGSKRIPNKNLALFGGEPLIVSAIKCAKLSKYINRIIVSTDSKEIAMVAKSYGAEVPFRRPNNISQWDSTELDAFKHALNWLEKNEGYKPDIIVKLFSTTPFRTAKSVDKAIRLFLDNPRADSVRSVRMCYEHPHKMWTKRGKWLKSLIPLSKKLPEAHTLSYQLLPPVYIQNAAIDVIRAANISQKNSITGKRILPFIMDEIESLDINNSMDLDFANFIFQKKLDK